MINRSQLTAIAILVAVVGIGWWATRVSPFVAGRLEIAGAVTEVGDNFIVVVENLRSESSPEIFVEILPETEIIQVPENIPVGFVELSVGDYVKVQPSGRRDGNEVEAAKIEVENLIPHGHD